MVLNQVPATGLHCETPSQVENILLEQSPMKNWPPGVAAPVTMLPPAEHPPGLKSLSHQAERQLQGTAVGWYHPTCEEHVRLPWLQHANGGQSTGGAGLAQRQLCEPEDPPQWHLHTHGATSTRTQSSSLACNAASLTALRPARPAKQQRLHFCEPWLAHLARHPRQLRHLDLPWRGR